MEDQRERWLQGQGDLFQVHQTTVETLISTVWPESDWSFQAGPVRGGVTDDPAEELELVFERFVASQYQRDRYQRRADEEVWSVYRKPLTRITSRRVSGIQLGQAQGIAD